MGQISEEPSPPKREFGTRIILLLELQLLITLIYVFSPQNIIFWSLTILLVGNLEIIAWKKLQRTDEEHSKLLWRRVLETPFLPILVLVLLFMVVLDNFWSRLKIYKLSKEEEDNTPEQQKSDLVIKRLTLYLIRGFFQTMIYMILLVLIPVLTFMMYSNLISWSITSAGFGIYEKSGGLVFMVSFVLMELSMIGVYYFIDWWVRKPYYTNETQQSSV